MQIVPVEGSSLARQSVIRVIREMNQGEGCEVSVSNDGDRYAFEIGRAIKFEATIDRKNIEVPERLDAAIGAFLKWATWHQIMGKRPIDLAAQG